MAERKKPTRPVGGRPLVLSDPTVLVRRANERLVVMREKVEVAAAPIAELSHVAVHGPATLTGAALAGLLDAGVDVTLYSSAGLYRGTISSARSGNVYLLLAQVDAWKQDAKRTAFARASLASKIAGQRVLVRRHAIDRGNARCKAAAKNLDALERAVAQEETVDGARGVEGAAAAVYFEVFGEMLGGAWDWRGRRHRPATDPVNAMLSYGYAIATGEVTRALAWNGFDPRIGMVHGLRYGRESLALDVVEEFRATMVDRFVLRVLNRKQIGKDDFDEPEDDGSVRLTAEGRRKFLALWEEMMSLRAAALPGEGEFEGDGERAAAARIGREGSGPGGLEPGAERNWRGRIERQVHRLRRFLMKGEGYVGLLGRRKDGEAVENDSHGEEDDAEAPENG